jgi:hypothetical protein
MVLSSCEFVRESTIKKSTRGREEEDGEDGEAEARGARYDFRGRRRGGGEM